jgi:superkiller protein 3
VKSALILAVLSAVLALDLSGLAAPAQSQDRARMTLPATSSQSSSGQKSADSRVKEGIRLADLNQLSPAAEQFVEALLIDPDNTTALYNLGLIRLKWGDLNEGASSFREVLRIDPNYAAAQHRLASILTQFARDDQNYIPQANAAYARAIELDPNQPEAYFNLGYLAVRSQDYSSAVTQYKKTLALDPHYPRVHLELGVSLYQLHDFEAAYPLLQLAQAEEGDSAEAHHYYGLVLGKRGQWQTAVEELRTAARLAPDEQEIHYALADALRKSGHSADADAEFAIVQNLQAHSSDETRARFRDYQAKKSIEAGEFDNAIEDYRQSLALNRDARTATNLGVALLWKGNLDDAIQALQQALEIDPKYEWADYYLGVSYAHKHDFEKAENALNNALRLRSEFSEAEFYRGLVYAAEGRFQQAEPDLRAAIRSRPDAAATHYYLGTVLLRSGKEKEGEAELEISRRLDPKFNPHQLNTPPSPYGAVRSGSNQITSH